MKYLVNPNFIYIISFSAPFLIYGLGWSTLYPNLTFSLLLFYLFTFCVCIILGVIISSIVKIKYNDIPEFPYNKAVLACLFIFYLIDIVYSGYVPLFAFSSGSVDYDPTTGFGLPTITPIIFDFNAFFSLYVFHQYVSTKKFRLIVIYLLTLLPFFLILARSSIMYNVIGCFYIYLLSKKDISVFRYAKLTMLGLTALFLFGYLGNLRSAQGDSTLIPKWSDATNEFLEGWVPNEFYWTYLYVASPVAGLQNNINTTPDVEPNIKSFIVYECLPDFISKKLGPAIGAEKRSFNQLNSWLNVGTVYANPFSYLSWTGMILMFVYLLGLMNLYYLLISKSLTFKVTGCAMMFNALTLANFSNTIQYSGFSFQLIFPIIFSIILYELRRMAMLKNHAIA